MSLENEEMKTQLIKQYCYIPSVWTEIQGIPRAREIKTNKEDSNPRPKGMDLLEFRWYTSGTLPFQ